MTHHMAAPNPLKPWTTAPCKRYRLKNAKLIDPKDGSLHDNVTIELKDGLIHRMTKLSGSEVHSWTQAEGLTLIDLEGKYVLPGLIDCHVRGFINTRSVSEQLINPL